MKTTFGMHSRLLVINSLKYANSDSYPCSLWSYLNTAQAKDPAMEKEGDLMSSSSLEGVHPLEDVQNDTMVNDMRGHFLSTKDVEGLSAFVREFSTQSVIPFMEKSISGWNETIASSRRGLTGRFFTASKKYFNSGAKAPAPSATTSGNVAVNYPYTSPEAQLRKLADYAFMLQDYRFAMVIYDTVKKDFLADKAFKHLAGAHVLTPFCLFINFFSSDCLRYISFFQEMMAICEAILNENPKEIEGNFDVAVSNYIQKCKLPLYATRTTLIFYEYLKARSLYREANVALIRATSEVRKFCLFPFSSFLFLLFFIKIKQKQKME
jgi:hypothetical protein